MDKYACGTCDRMCSQREVQMRTKEKLLHFFEANPPPSPLSRQQRIVCVSEFSRSAAGNRTPRTADLRTPAALRRSVEYLFDRILLDCRKPFWFVYGFVFDRLRCVRQEIVIQQLGELETIGLLEPIVMFLAYSSYRLCEASIENFDPYVCNQHLQECLKRLLCCYDAVHGDKALRNRHTFESMYLIFNLGSPEAIARGLRLLPLLRQSNGRLVQISLDMSLYFHAHRYIKVLAQMQRLPMVLAGVAVQKLQTMRRFMLATFSVAYQSKVLAVPLQWLSAVLLYADQKQLTADLKHYRCQLNATGDGVLFVRNSFDAQIDVIKPRQEVFVNIMFADDRDLIDVLLLNTL